MITNHLAADTAALLSHQTSSSENQEIT